MIHPPPPAAQVKTVSPDGGACVAFLNGDLKRQLPCGRVDYYYAEVATWQVGGQGAE